jgi:uncharacterized SAM-binding protein YcdF (DUF218 family)
MFFTFAKIFWFVVQPLGALLVLLVLAVIALLLGWRRIGTGFAVLALLVTFVSGWTSVGAMALHPLENRFKRPSPPPDNVAGIIVLGGFFEGAINLARGGYELNSSADRIVEAAVLARRYPQARVVVTGGSGSLLLDGEADGATAPRLLEALGIERGRMVLEDQSRDTYENALFTRELVEPQEGETWLLVTSAFHMPRSVMLFRRAGFDVVPWPVDYRTTGEDSLGLSRNNVVHTLQTTGVALREWIGLVAYWVTGRTDAILPGRE